MQGEWSVLRVNDKPVDLFDPPSTSRVSFGILFLHDIGGETLKGHSALRDLFASLGIACLCPRTGACWWVDRICAEFDQNETPEKFLLHSLMPAFSEHWELEPPRIGLLGFGMGGQAALKIAFKHPTRFPTVAALSSKLDYHELYGRGTALDEMYDSREQCRQDTALLHIHPSHYPPHIFFAADPRDSFWYRGSDRLHEKLIALGIPHEF